MHANWFRLDVVIPLWAVVCVSLAQFAWRARTTAVGRAFAVLAGFASLASLLSLAAMSGREIAEWVSPILAFVCAVSGGAVLRLALVAVNGVRRRLPPGLEIAIAAGVCLVGLVGDLHGLAAWLLSTHALAAERLARLPRRSWQGFDGALRATRLSFVAVGCSAAIAFVAASSEIGYAIAGMGATLLAIGIAIGFPRLGLLAQDRVAHHGVIEAMSDGVMVVDLDDRLVEVNQSARAILELGDADLDLRPLSEVLAHHPDLVELFRGAIEGETIYAPRARREADGQRTYDLRLSALEDERGAIQSRVLVLRDISDRIAIEDENRRQARQLRLVHEVASGVAEADTLEHGVDTALALVAEAMGHPVANFLRSHDGSEGSRLVASGLVYCAPELAVDPAELRMQSAARADGDPASRPTLQHLLSQGVVDYDPQGLHWWRSLGLELDATIPIVVGNRLYGVFELFGHPGTRLAPATAELLEQLGAIVGQAVEKRLAEERVRRFAYRDDLTGLPNRQHFHQILRAAVALAERSERRMALLFLDLDGFKKVNDTLGHETGDKLLAEVAARFSKVVRVSDHLGRQGELPPDQSSSISRLGGDEFTVLLSEIQQPSDAAVVAERLLGTLVEPIRLSGQDLFMATSIGIAVFPEDGADAETLVRNADAAMYFAKGRGRNGYSFYSVEMNRTQSQRLEIESRLRVALERGQFEIHYQPIRSAESGRVVAAEALVRWRDPEWGMVPPDKFIPVAEETGLIVGLGQWVFRGVCEQARRWREEWGSTIRIGVNVSGQQIREPGMVEMVREALAETGVAPTQVELEITESTIMQDDELTKETLRALKAMGVRIALDDFGTGYSSLSYLRRFPIDRVKIDRTFVAELPDNPSDAALTSAIIAMAHGLALDVVAEGVETEAQAHFLELRGCDELQGYLFGRPCPADAFVDWLRARPAERAEDCDAKPE